MSPTESGMPSSSFAGSGSVSPAPRQWSRYVAIGDSFTEGLCDLDPEVDGHFVGWADRLAALLAPHTPGAFGYANLAVRGRMLAQIAGAQTETALALQPDLVSIVGGGNDILRPRADLDTLAEQLEDAVVRLRATGADVLVASPTDPRDAPVIRATRGRMAIYTAHIWKIAQRHGCYVLNQWGLDFLRDWRMWSQDRIHLTSEGHRRVALAAYAGLGHDPADVDWHVPLPPGATPGRLEVIRDNAQWAKQHAGPWVARRFQGRSSGDHISAKRPEVMPLHAIPEGDPR